MAGNKTMSSACSAWSKPRIERPCIVDEELWQSAQEARMKRQRRRDGTTSRASVYSLTGLMKCFHCGGQIHLHRDPQGKPRGYCYNRTQGTKDCKQKGTFLYVYEEKV